MHKSSQFSNENKLRTSGSAQNPIKKEKNQQGRIATSIAAFTKENKRQSGSNSAAFQDLLMNQKVLLTEGDEPAGESNYKEAYENLGMEEKEMAGITETDNENARESERKRILYSNMSNYSEEGEDDEDEAYKSCNLGPRLYGSAVKTPGESRRVSGIKGNSRRESGVNGKEERQSRLSFNAFTSIGNFL